MNGSGTMSRTIRSPVGSLWAKMISRPRRSVRYVDCRNFQKSSAGSSATRTWLTSSTNFGGYLASVYKLKFLLVRGRRVPGCEDGADLSRVWAELYGLAKFGRRSS